MVLTAHARPEGYVEFFVAINRYHPSAPAVFRGRVGKERCCSKSKYVMHFIAT